VLCSPLSQINLTMKPGPVSGGRLGCVLACLGLGDRRVLPSARTPELKARALRFVGFPSREHVESAPGERFDKPELEGGGGDGEDGGAGVSPPQTPVSAYPTWSKLSRSQILTSIPRCDSHGAFASAWAVDGTGERSAGR